MLIRSYKFNTFAGLKDINMEFEDGLNVIYGLNESGKSTIIDGIHAVLFKDINLRRSVKADNEFIDKYFPYLEGNIIDSTIVIETEGDNYELKKEWGNNSKIELKTPDNTTIVGKTQVEEKLKDMFKLGESTYSNIVFAKQKDLKQSLDNILKNKEISEEINNILRMAFMELDGVSIDSIEKNIIEERDGLYKRWDKERNYPENNRGISNPYKTGLGRILEAYYNKERLKKEAERAEKTEKEFEEISNKVVSTEEKLKEIVKEKNKLEEVEEDVNSRELVSLELKGLNKEYGGLSGVSVKWPRSRAQLEQIDKKIIEIKEKKEELKIEKSNLEKLKRRKDIEKLISEIESILEKIKDLEENKKKATQITENDIETVETIEKEIVKSKLTLEVGQIFGKIELKTEKDLYISGNFGEKLIKEKLTELECGGYLKINYADEIMIEIKTGDIDFEAINKSIKENENKLKELFKRLNIEDLNAGKENLKKLKKIDEEIKNLKDKLEIRTEKGDIIELKEELKTLQDISSSRDVESIEKELSKIEQEEVDNTSKKISIENDIKNWIEEYDDERKLTDLMLDKRILIREKEEKLKNLKPLPEEFDTVEEFKEKLIFLRERERKGNDYLNNAKNNYFEIKSNLSTESFEELNNQYKEKEKEFEKLLLKGEKIDIVYKAFLKTKEKMEQNPLETLINEFGRLLGVITNNRYEIKAMDESFNLRLTNPEGEMPLELLSAGTYDSVALALRFALIKHVFKNEKGYLVLDDCLVDLDKHRKAEAVKLIKEFSKDYQIIFTTCDEDTAYMLSDNPIVLA